MKFHSEGMWTFLTKDLMVPPVSYSKAVSLNLAWRARSWKGQSSSWFWPTRSLWRFVQKRVGSSQHIPHSCQASHCLVSYLHTQWILFININKLHISNEVNMWVILLVGTGKCKKICKRNRIFNNHCGFLCFHYSLCISRPQGILCLLFNHKCSYSTTGLLQSIMKNQLLWSWRARLHGEFNLKLSD